MAEPSPPPPPPPSSNSGLRILLTKDRAPASSPSTLAAVSSHADRDRIIGVFRTALARNESPEAFALQAVQEAIKPQKQTVLVLEENQSLENALRRLLQELVSSAVQSGNGIMQYGNSLDSGESNCLITRLLDIMLYLCERGHVEGGMVFQLLEDLTDMSTIKDCKDVFGYIESKQDVLGKQELFGRGKLVMLRTCNQLLRRLSKLKDASFRRHILVQCLIFFDYLKAPGKSDKDGPSESMKEEIKSCEERVKNLLEMIPPKGKEFLQSIEHILEREKNWVWWKRDGCPAFEKQPFEKKPVQAGVRKRKPRWRLGNKELAQLWKWAELNPNALTDPDRVCTPSITEYWKPLAEDMDPSAGIEEDYHHKNNRVYCWKGLRFSARQDLEGFSRFCEYGIEGVVPPELLPPDVRAKFNSKPGEKAKRPKREDTKGTSSHPKEPQAAAATPDTDGGGSGDQEEGAVPMDSDNPVVDDGSQKRSPGEVSGPESGQCEAEDDGEDNSKTAHSRERR
uniref:Uncharacterized protein n=1 Tax=Avena sativa TaxID=4498 RepID=A0ACD5WI89_AVESA